ncbi:unnamed protein product [Penicillium salamii]|nr:unnamed protein product [Penicillium salamii]
MPTTYQAPPPRRPRAASTHSNVPLAFNLTSSQTSTYINAQTTTAVVYSTYMF